MFQLNLNYFQLINFIEIVRYVSLMTFLFLLLKHRFRYFSNTIELFGNSEGQVVKDLEDGPGLRIRLFSTNSYLKLMLVWISITIFLKNLLLISH